MYDYMDDYMDDYREVVKLVTDVERVVFRDFMEDLRKCLLFGHNVKNSLKIVNATYGLKGNVSVQNMLNWLIRKESGLDLDILNIEPVFARRAQRKDE